MEKAFIVREAAQYRAMTMRGRMVPDDGTAGRTRSLFQSSRKEFQFVVHI